jgi:hypothetical protein
MVGYALREAKSQFSLKQEGVIFPLLLRCPLKLQHVDDECPKSVDRLVQGLDVRTWSKKVMAALGEKK